MARIASTTSAGVPTGPAMTLDALMLRQKQLADAAGKISAADRPMTSPLQGAAYLGEVFANKLNQGRADRALAEGRQALAERMAGVSMEDGATAEQIAQVSQISPEHGMLLWKMAAEAMQTRRLRSQTLADRDDERTYQKGLTAEERAFEQADEIGDEQRAIQAKIDEEKRAAGRPQSGTAKILADFDAGHYGDPNTPEAQKLKDAALAKENAISSGVSVYTGDTSSKLRESFDDKEGENWQAYVKAGVKAGALVADMEILDELGKVAPQGQIPGRLQKAFPGINSAGAAFQAVVKRLAPQLRVEGSGSTSDIEYQGMLDSLPSLLNYPEGNLLISGVIKAKAEIDIRRSEIINDWRNQLLTDAEARTQLIQLSRQSIMTPELRLLIQNAAPAAASDLSTMSDEELDAEIARRRAQGVP